MHKIHFILFATIAITALACSKKDATLIDNFQLIKGKWKATKYEARISIGIGPSSHDSLINITNINNTGVPCLRMDSLDMIDFKSQDSIAYKYGKYNDNMWSRAEAINDPGQNRWYIDWYRYKILYTDGSLGSSEIKINNSNGIQIGYSHLPYYKWTYFERVK